MIYGLIFVVLTMVIVMGGVAGGIEKFCGIGMPALFFMLLICIVRACTLPGAVDGLKYMFVPGWAVANGVIEKAPSIFEVISTAGGQMFFSLSIGMGAMITYGSYLSKQENLVKNSAIIVIADTIVATMAGIAVIPAAVAHGIQQGIPVGEIALGGPSLLFVTLQNVFNSMGDIGALFGTLFYLLVLIAAISSAISLVEVVATFFIDRAAQKGRTANRGRVVLYVCLAILVEAALVAFDGLGSNGVWVPGQSLGIAGWNDCWLDFMDMLSEGLAMPLGALLMGIMVGWEIGPDSTLDEVHSGCGRGIDGFFRISIKFLVPLGMVLVLSGQISEFFGADAATIGYGLGIGICAVGLIAALTSPKRRELKK